MSLRRRLLTTAGFLAVLVGFVFVLRPALAFELADTKSFLVGALALVLGVRTLVGQRREPMEQAETPDPEVVTAFPQPGDEFDALLAGTRGRRRSNRYNKGNVRDRLEAVAIDVLVWRTGDTRAEAKRRLDAGEWTDDPYAAAFFAGGTASVSLRERVSDSLSRESRFQRQARHAADAIARHEQREAGR